MWTDSVKPMAWQVIEKPQGNWRVQPNLLSYERTCAEYSWRKAEQRIYQFGESRAEHRL